MKKKTTSTGSKHNNPSSKTSESKDTSPKNWAINPFAQEIGSLTFHASCGEGLIELLEEEVRNHSLKVLSKNRGGLFFRSKSQDKILAFLLTSTIASKIGIVIANWQVDDYEEFYEKAKDYPWDKILDKNLSFKIDSKTKDNLADSRFSMYKLKDAILDRFREKKIPFPDVKKDSADIGILLRSYMEHVALELLITPDSLTKRGYRSHAGVATLRENIASTLVNFSEWDRKKPLIDPFCGQATILIEAALSLKNQFNKNEEKLNQSYVFNRLFSDKQNSTNEKKTISPTKNKPLIIGMDSSEESLNLAKTDAKNAGVEDMILFYQATYNDIENILNENHIALDLKIQIITDPPFGKRMGSFEESKELYMNFGKWLKEIQRFIDLTLITGDSSLLGFLKLKKTKEMSLKNSNISSKIVNYNIYPKDHYIGNEFNGNKTSSK